MIDYHWFATVRCLSGASLDNDELARLTQVLGEQSEVLPYLLISADAFSDWPKAREAFRTAGRSVIRTSTSGVTAIAPPNLTDRHALAEVLLSRLQPADNEPKRDGLEVETLLSEVELPAQPDADRLIAALRVQTGDLLPRPQDFIGLA